MSFLNEYTVLGELGKGGFAKVYKVRHNELGYIRAIRVLSEPVTDEKSKTYQKFLHECKVLLRLGNGNHRNIVHIYQPRLLENHALVEMDYVEGQDITHYLKDNGHFLPIEEVLRMVEEMSDALAYCHEDIYQFCMNPDEDDLQNDPIDGSKWLVDEATKARLIEKYKVIHNDIHSGNIMRRKDGSFVLLDFGLAIEGDEVVKSSSRHENGAPEYMSPEKWDNEAILTEQSDIYSFGVVMYEYLAGRVPYVCEGNSFNARTKLYEKIKNSTGVPSIFNLRKTYFEEKFKGQTYQKDYPDWLEEAIQKCLEKDPAKRFRNGKALHDFIMKHLQEDTSSEITALTKNNDDLAALADATIRDLEETRNQLNQAFQEKKQLEREIGNLKKGRKNKLLPIVLCAIFAIAAAVFGYLYLNSNGGTDISGDDSIATENARLKTEIENLKAENTGLKSDIENQKSENASLKSENASLKSENACLKETNEKLQNQITDLNTSVTELEDELNNANTTKSNLEKQIRDLNTEIDKLRKASQTPSAREKQLENDLKQANSDKEKQKKEFEKKLNDQKTNYEKQLEDQKTKYENYIYTLINK